MTNDDDELLPTGLSARQEQYCQLRVAGKSQKEAGMLAGYSPGAAWKAEQSRRVRARLTQLFREQFDAIGLCPEKIILDLETTRQAASEKGDYGSATRCSELQGKFLAMFSDRVIAGGDQEQSDHLKERTEEEKAAIRRMAQERSHAMSNTARGASEPAVQLRVRQG